VPLLAISSRSSKTAISRFGDLHAPLRDRGRRIEPGDLNRKSSPTVRPASRPASSALIQSTWELTLRSGVSTMITVTADAALGETLSKLDKPAEIRDEGGHVIGYFAPAGQPKSLLYLQAAAHFNPEEMQRRKNSGERGYSTAEVLEHLNSLEQP
jgi:hypothetical protein